MSAELSNKRPTDKDIAGVFRCIDRHDRTPDDYDYYRISSKELKKGAYSGKYKPVIDWLVENGCIEVDDFYISGSRFKGYKVARRPDVAFDAPEDEPSPAIPGVVYKNEDGWWSEWLWE
jgi:hypothetical protein